MCPPAAGARWQGKTASSGRGRPPCLPAASVWAARADTVVCPYGNSEDVWAEAGVG
jgi:hypothetical protein